MDVNFILAAANDVGQYIKLPEHGAQLVVVVLAAIQILKTKFSKWFPTDKSMTRLLVVAVGVIVTSADAFMYGTWTDQTPFLGGLVGLAAMAGYAGKRLVTHNPETQIEKAAAKLSKDYVVVVTKK